MQLFGDVPTKARGFAEVLDSILHSGPKLRRRLLRTAHDWHYLTDNFFLSALSREEKEAVGKAHHALLQSEDEYLQTDSFDLIEVLPQRVGEEVSEALYAGKGKHHHLILLRGNGLEILTEARAFLTVHQRHPNAVWRFSRGRNFSQMPVVLLEPHGFFSGRLLGAVNPVKIKDGVGLPAKNRGEDVWAMTVQSNNQIFYFPED